MKIFVVLYSRHGHIFKLAQAVAEGVQSVEGVSVEMYRTADQISSSKQIERKTAIVKSYAQLPVIDARRLAEADAIIFGIPTSIGMIASPMRCLLDQIGSLWGGEALIGKVGSVFTSTTPQTSEHNSTLDAFHTMLLHLGMVVVGVPYYEKRILPDECIKGRDSYGASTVIGSDGTRKISSTEVGSARFQGQYAAETALFIKLGKESKR